jgi:hypothetical protein
MLARVRSRFLEVRRDERGIAVITALMALVASFALASVAVMSTVDVQRGTVRDHDSKEAIAAANAGANVALLRLNRFLPTLSLANPCVGPAGESQLAEAEWCPSTQSEGVGDAVYSYRVSAFGGPGTALNIVSVGSSGTVSRRVNVSLTMIDPDHPFADEKLIGKEAIEFKGSAVNVKTDLGSNGEIIRNGTSHPTICGNARHGIGKGPVPPLSCGKTESEGSKTLPAVLAPENIATLNSDCRLAVTCQNITEVDTYATSNEKKEHRTSTNPWDAAHMTINVGGSAKLTMGGGDYWVCGIYAENGEIIMAAGPEVSVRIFVDTPEDCGMQPGETQVEFKGSAGISSSGFNPAQGTYNVPAIYLLGDGGVKLNGNSGTNDLILYAPESEIEIGGNATWIGMLAGKSVTIPGNPTIESNSNIKEPEFPFTPLFERTRYVECTGATATPPNANC